MTMLATYSVDGGPDGPCCVGFGRGPATARGARRRQYGGRAMFDDDAIAQLS
jgi:hypothetical protein